MNQNNNLHPKSKGDNRWKRKKIQGKSLNDKYIKLST